MYDPISRLKHDDTKKAMQFVLDNTETSEHQTRGYTPERKRFEKLFIELEKHRQDA